MKSQTNNMKSQTNKFPCLLLLIAGSAVFLLSSAGIARILGRSPIASSGADDMLSFGELVAIKVRCSECCVIT